MDMFTRRACDHVEDDSVFRRVEGMIDRRRLPGRRRACARTRGAPDMDMMIRVILIGAWYSLSDRE